MQTMVAISDRRQFLAEWPNAEGSTFASPDRRTTNC
jgi:hypothetical protein